MNYFDVILIITIALFTIRGLFRGLITELMSLIALILGFFIASYYLSACSEFLTDRFTGLPVAGAKILSFILVFVAVTISIRFLAILLNQFAKFTFLQPVNKIAGGVFSFIKILLILSIVFLVVDMIPHSDVFLRNFGIDQSLLFEPVKTIAPGVYRLIVVLLPDHDKLYQDFIHLFNRADTTAREFIKTTP